MTYMENLICIKTKKFKHLNVSFRFTCPYEALKRTELQILGAFIGKYSQGYPDKQSMRKAKDMLYGIKASSRVNVQGGLMTFSVDFQFANPRFFKDIKSSDYISFIDDCMHRPYLDEKLFKEAVSNLKSDIERYLDKPKNAENVDLIAEIAKDVPAFMSYSKDLRPYLAKTTYEDIVILAKELFINFNLYILLLGDYDEELYAYLKGYTTNIPCFHQEDKALALNKRDDVIKQIDSDQSYLSLIYTSPYTRAHEDYMAFVIMEVMLGGSPLSLLFAEVRERQGLCYSIDSGSYRNEGLLRIATGIDGDKLAIVKKAVDEEIGRLKSGTFDDELLIASKRLLLNSIDTLQDDSEDYLNFIFANLLSLYPLDTETYKKAVEAVSRQDVIRVASHLQAYLCHFYQGVKNG